MKKLFPLVASAAILASALPAFAVKYECNLKMSRSGGNWMGPTVHVDYDEKAGTATVIDGVLNYYFGKPQKVDTIDENKKKITFVYKVRMPTKTTKGGSKVLVRKTYRLTVQKHNMKATISMKPVGYGNTWRDSGWCTVK